MALIRSSKHCASARTGFAMSASGRRGCSLDGLRLCQDASIAFAALSASPTPPPTSAIPLIFVGHLRCLRRCSKALAQPCATRARGLLTFAGFPTSFVGDQEADGGHPFALLFGAVSLLYATVGQAGGTGFLALMAFASFPSNDRIDLDTDARIGPGKSNCRKIFEPAVQSQPLVGP
jgi:hypothetical protein